MTTALSKAIQWLDSQRPAHCSRAGWRSFQLGLLFLPTSALLAGLGLVETYRTQFASEISKSGIDGLIASLSDKAKIADKSK